jgi:DNA polymerase III subunit chi
MPRGWSRWPMASGALGFDRVFYLFPPDKTGEAREAWKALKDRDGIERRYWKQDGGKWRQGP